MTAPYDLPQPSFTIIVTQLVTQALIQVGEIPNPVTGKSERSLTRARFTFGLLEILADRTRGNLEPAEEALLTRALADLRSRIG